MNGKEGMATIQPIVTLMDRGVLSPNIFCTDFETVLKKFLECL